MEKYTNNVKQTFICVFSLEQNPLLTETTSEAVAELVWLKLAVSSRRALQMFAEHICAFCRSEEK